MNIDAHHHFWTFEQSRYEWIEPWMNPLRRDYGPSDLAPELSQSGIEGTILVEARGHIEETETLLAIANSVDFAQGVVGWLPLWEEGVERYIEKYAANPKLRGMRHAINAEPDPDFMNRRDFNRGIDLLEKHGLAFDLSFQPPQLATCLDFIDAHPNQTFILDHLAKPYIRESRIEPWKARIEALAERPHIYCKVSGLATEADRDSWTEPQLHPYLDIALDAFTPDRLMFGSDWPVCLLATGYKRWRDTIDAWLEPLSPSERRRINGETAEEAYGLNLQSSHRLYSKKQ